MPPSRALTDRFLSPGALLILSFAVVSSVLVLLLPSSEPEGIEYWVFVQEHASAYEARIERWNRENPDRVFVMKLLHGGALERRMLSGFLTGTPTADLMEVTVGMSPKAFLGPIDRVGFLDLTERLHEEGLYEQFNKPSLSPHTSRGHIFGLPHDVHPAVLAYRADIVEAAGIDVSEIETWEDYFRVMRPLMVDLDGDGRPDRYSLNFSEFNQDMIIGFLLQNDGVLFDEHEQPAFANERNARSLATMVTWVTGPERASTPVPIHSPSGLKQLMDGLVIGTPVGDIQLGMWKFNTPRLSGMMKVMPLPAWERGGRRTTVLGGGTMIGINKRSPHIEAAWEMAKELYMSREIAEATYRTNMIISPVKAFWDESFYHEPDPFFCGQSPGSFLVAAAPNVPTRPSSPYTPTAYGRIGVAMISLRAYADKHGIYDVEGLFPEALRLLQAEEESLKKLISRNLLYEESPAI